MANLLPVNGAAPNPGNAYLVDPYGIPVQGPTVTNDPGFQPPDRNLLLDTGALASRADRISREIPNVIVETGWTIGGIRRALADHMIGIFDTPAQLQDALAGDSRVQSAMRSISGGLLGKEIQFRLPKGLEDDGTAKKCLRMWSRHWPEMHAEPAILDMIESAPNIGFAYAQILWDTAGKYWLPYIQSFNARYSYYHWLLRSHIAVTLDGQEKVNGGDGHWILFAPYGQYRGWMRGAIRALAQWFLARSYALRDWARYSERHGFPMILADTPFGADPLSVASFRAQLDGVGQETILQIPGSVKPAEYGKFDLRYLEPKDEGWQAFKELIAQCNIEITLALLGQNLTSEVKEGSFAAARVHADVRQAYLELLARALAKTLHVQVLRPFAALNFGDPKYAPQVLWKISPPEDQLMKARTFAAVGDGLQKLRQAGIRVKDPVKLMRGFGLKLTDVEHVDPTQVEAKAFTGADANGAGALDPDDYKSDDDESDDDKSDDDESESEDK